MTPAKPYTDAEDRKIARLYQAGTPPKLIAERLERSRGSVEARLRKLGVERKRCAGISRAGCQWDALETRIIEEHRDKPIDVLQSMLPGRSRSGIIKRMHKLFGEAPLPPQARPLGVPYKTKSGVWAITLASGPIPYVPTIHAHLHGGPLDRVRISDPLS